jgi:hypothetical protein
MRLSPFAALILASGLAQAQTIGTGLKTASTVINDFKKDFSAQQSNAKSDEILDRVMVSMYDQPGTGEDTVKWLRDQRIDVKFSDEVQGPSDHVKGVRLNSALKNGPLSHRYFGALIAKEASELMMKDMPEFAEKRYMVSSRMAETYAELGGGVSMPPNFDGITDKKTAADMEPWIENFTDPDRGVQFLKERGSKDIPTVLASARKAFDDLQAERQEIIGKLSQTPEDTQAWKDLQALLVVYGKALGKVQKDIDASEKALRRFEAFKRYEKEWLGIHPIRQ